MDNVFNFSFDSVLVHGKYGVKPVCMEEGSVGYDISLPEHEGHLVMPYGSRRVIDTGVIVKPLMKCFTLIVPRSNSFKKGIRISNTVGIIDPSYCGQEDTIKVSITREPKMDVFQGKFDPQLLDLQTFCSEMGITRETCSVVIDPDGIHHVYQTPCHDYLVYGAGERFCQALFIPYSKPLLLEKALNEMGEGNRGGYGSTGMK